MTDTIKFTLPESEIPKDWYNVVADLPSPPPPPLHPGTGQPIVPDDLAPLFPMALIGQEVSMERTIKIPQPVRDIYRQWRPTSLHRARRLEQALDTPAHIYYKYEGVSPAGSHKPNTAVAQAFYNKEAGISRISTETGAGQWGSSLAFAGALFGIEVEVFMVRVSFDQKPYRRSMMESFGARCVASPSNETEVGRAAPSLPNIRIQAVASVSPSARRWRSPPGAMIPIMRSVGAEPCVAAPDRGRPGSHEGIRYDR
jgi:tryptophan synthase beta chain